MKRTVLIIAIAMGLIAHGEIVPQNLGSIRVNTPIYTASQTDERIRELAGSSDKITDGTNTLSANLDYEYEKVTNTWVVNGIPYTTTTGYTYCSFFPKNPNANDIGYTLTLFEGSSWESGYYDLSIGAWYWRNQGTEESPDYQWVSDSGGITGLLPANGKSFQIEDWVGTYPVKGVVKSRVALTNDIPPHVTVVAPTTNAVAGTAADAKATGTALYTGFTEWEFGGESFNQRVKSLEWSDENERWEGIVLFGPAEVAVYPEGDKDATSLSLLETDIDIIATRHLITPTKTSQLTNDSGFLTSHQDISGKLDGAAAYPAWSSSVRYGVGSIVSHNGRLWHTEDDTIGGGVATEEPDEHSGEWYEVFLKDLKQDALSDAQVDAIDSVMDDRQTVVVYQNGTTNRLDLVGELSSSDIPNIGNATSVRIGSAVTSIGNGALSECFNLTSVTIPNSVTSIGNGAFYNCTRMTRMTIPASMTNIGDNVFAYCIGLTSVTIPNSVTSIGSSAFESCSGLTNIVFKGKSLAEVSAMPNYSSWGINTSIITTENEATKEWVGEQLPTKTSQLTNDGSNGVPFFVSSGGTINGNVTMFGTFAQGCAGVNASGLCAHAEGTNTTASGMFSHAEGSSTTASGNYSHAEGNLSKATGAYSHAQGYNTKAIGSASSAFGITSHAYGRASFAAGANANATNDLSFVWSSKDSGSSSSFYTSHGAGTFNINPTNGLAGVWIGETNLQNHIRREMSSDLPYAIVTPGEWSFSGIGENETIYSGPTFTNSGEEYFWQLVVIEDSSQKVFVSDSWYDESHENDLSVTFQYESRYITATRASLPGHLLNRANNQVKSSDTLQMTLPPPIPNKSRDFRVRLVITAPITSPDKITFVGATTNGVQESISFETENGTFPTLNTISTNILHFTETAPSIFYISNKAVAPAPAP